MQNKPILHLNLKRKWYDMIASGSKKEEYREIKDSWKRIFRHDIKIKGKYYHPTDVIICFSNGYKKKRDQMLVECIGLSIGGAVPVWSDNWEGDVFILKLGNILKK